MSTSHRNDSSPVRRNPHVKKIISEPAKRMAEAMPHKLLDTLVVRLRVKNDADLCRLLDLLPPFLSRIRHRKNPLGPGVLLHIHETTGIPIAELKALLAASN